MVSIRNCQYLEQASRLCYVPWQTFDALERDAPAVPHVLRLCGPRVTLLVVDAVWCSFAHRRPWTAYLVGFRAN